MAYEAYTATVEHIAQTAFAEWRQGNDTEQLIQQMSRDADVEEWHCNRELTKIIINDYHNTLLSRAS